MCELACEGIGIYTTLWVVTADGNHDAKRTALDLLLISGAPLNHAGRNSTGIWGVNRQGCRFSRPAPWMARGGGPPNHWRITGTPSLSEVPSGGARAFCLLLRFSKVSRRQGGTLGGRYRSNGYVLGITVSTVSPSSQASQLPHWISRCLQNRGYSPSSDRPGCSSGRRPSGQWNLRSLSLIGISLMQAKRLAIKPFSSNSQFSLPYERYQLPESSCHS